jgi:hypothetical protein
VEGAERQKFEASVFGPSAMPPVKSIAFLSPAGWRVELEVECRKFVSRPYAEKPEALASAEQQPMLIKRLEAGDTLGGYWDLDDFLYKAVLWFGWEEKTGWDMEGNAEQVAITLAVKQEAQSSRALFEQVKTFTIFDQQGLDIAGSLLKDVKARWKDIEGRRKSITQPMQAALKNVQALFKEPLDYYASIEAMLKEKILDAQQRARAAQDAALLAVQQAHAAGDRTQVAVALHQAQQAEAVNPEGLQNRSTWTYSIIDAQQVPREFWVIDYQALAAYVRQTKGTVKIPGVHVYEQPSVAVKI